MEIKGLLQHLKKNFDRIILAGITLILILCVLQYLTLLRKKSEPFGEKELCKFIGVQWLEETDIVSGDRFRELVDKKINFVLGIKPLISYKRLMHRNPFAPLRDLVIKPFALTPAALKIGLGESASFQTLYGIGPYTWKCEPENLGTFEGNIFETGTRGLGKVIATDARGERAIAELEVMAKKEPGVVKPPKDTDSMPLIYKGPMRIITPSGEELLAFIEDTRTGRLYTKKTGEGIDGFVVKDITQEKLILFDKKKGKEIELRPE